MDRMVDSVGWPLLILGSAFGLLWGLTIIITAMALIVTYRRRR